MSGLIPEIEGDEVAQRYQQRFKELTQNRINKSLATISATGRFMDSLVPGQNNNHGHISNGTLATSQFYGKNIQVQSEIISSRLINEAPSTCTGMSDTSDTFKKPFPVNGLIRRSHKERRIDLLVENIRSIEDKAAFKFVMVTIETLVHSIKNLPPQPVNPINLMEYISDMVKEDYNSKRVPKSICGSSAMSYQSSIDQQSIVGSERSIRLDKPMRTDPVKDSLFRYPLHNVTQTSQYNSQGQLNRPTGNYSTVGRTVSSHYLPETSIASKASSSRGRLATEEQPSTVADGTKSTFNFFNDSDIARRRDEAAASMNVPESVVVLKKAGKTLPKPTPSSNVGRKPKTNNKPARGRPKLRAKDAGDCTVSNNTNCSLLNGTASVSRSGRIVKPPVKYWDSKRTPREEISSEDNESIFNESMTLRNKKIVEKKYTPPVRGGKINTSTPQVRGGKKNSPPLEVVNENEEDNFCRPTTKEPKKKDMTTTKEPKKKDMTTTKEPKKKDVTVTKQTKKKDVTITKETKKKDVNKSTKQTVKKTTQKRKSNETNDSVSKKKKMEDSFVSDDEDDIFGGVTYYKKPKQQNLKVALSPSAALLSAKKAAGEAEGKATPPCKTIGDMMANESVQSAMSAAKEAPKPNEAIKRIIKKIEKAPSQNKAMEKGQVKARSQSNVVSKHRISNPMCAATLTVIRGEQESDMSDMDLDDEDNEDLM